MRLLRRLLPLLCLVMGVCIGVQATDLLACGDESASEATCADAHTDGGGEADCYCHLVFVPTAALPRPLVRPETRTGRGPAPAPDALPDGVAPPFVRPPIG